MKLSPDPTLQHLRGPENLSLPCLSVAPLRSPDFPQSGLPKLNTLASSLGIDNGRVSESEVVVAVDMVRLVWACKMYS